MSCRAAHPALLTVKFPTKTAGFPLEMPFPYYSGHSSENGLLIDAIEQKSGLIHPVMPGKSRLVGRDV